MGYLYPFQHPVLGNLSTKANMERTQPPAAVPKTRIDGHVNTAIRPDVMSESEELQEIKVVLWGLPESGKTHYVKQLTNSHVLSSSDYFPTVGAEVHRVQCPDQGFMVNLWDIAGQKHLQGLLEGYFVASHAAMLMYRPEDIHKAKEFIHILSSCLPAETPILLVANHGPADVERHESQCMVLTQEFNHMHSRIHHVCVDVKDGERLLEPFLLIQRLVQSRMQQENKRKQETTYQ